MRGIGDELQAKTNVIARLSERGEEIKISDLCMAPGGFRDSALKYNHTATACGITLLPAQVFRHRIVFTIARQEHGAWLASAISASNRERTELSYFRWLAGRLLEWETSERVSGLDILMYLEDRFPSAICPDLWT